jgi:hypothetical protein
LLNSSELVWTIKIFKQKSINLFSLILDYWLKLEYFLLNIEMIFFNYRELSIIFATKNR